VCESFSGSDLDPLESTLRLEVLCCAENREDKAREKCSGDLLLMDERTTTLNTDIE
jgi:hypothetical protein